MERGFIKKVLELVPDAKKGVGKSVFFAFIYEFLRFVPIIIVKIIVDEIVSGQNSLTKLAWFLGGVLASYLILTVIDYFVKKVQFKWLIEWQTQLMRRTKKKLLQLHFGFHETINTSELLSKITKGVHKLSELTWFMFNEFIPTLVQLIVTVIILFYEKWLLALVFTAFLPILLFVIITASKKVQVYRKSYHQNFDEAIGELGESLMNISTVKDYVQEKEQFRKYDSLLAKYEKNAQQRWDYEESFLIWRDLLISLGRALTLGLAAWMVLEGVLSAGSLVLVYTLTERAFLSSYRIGRLYSYLEDAMESLNRLYDLLKEKVMINDMTKAQGIKSLQGEVEFREVNFSYNKVKVIDKVNFKIAPRQVVALVGRSGSGKSTLVKLMLRNYDINSGEILVDGKNIQNYKIADYKRRLAVVSQNVEIFNRTVFENISFANPQASREEVVKAAKKAHAHEFIQEFSDGYNSLVGEKGIRLSGGQKQRVSIARALLKRPDVYIFDEATSSLDSESEELIQKSIFSIAGKKTTIIIAHRLSTIKHADLIMVLDKGKIIERGTYEALLKKNGLFAKMVKLQSVNELRE